MRNSSTCGVETASRRGERAARPGRPTPTWPARQARAPATGRPAARARPPPRRPGRGRPRPCWPPGPRWTAGRAGGWTALLWAASNGHADTRRAPARGRGRRRRRQRGRRHPAHAGGPARRAGRRARAAGRRGRRRKYDGDGDTPLDIAADWVGVHLESALLDQIEQDDWEYRRRPRQFAKDGTELVTVAGRSPTGRRREQVQASAATRPSRPCWRRPPTSTRRSTSSWRGPWRTATSTRTPRRGGSWPTR